MRKGKESQKFLQYLLAILSFCILAPGIFAQKEESKSPLKWSLFEEPSKEYRPLVRWWWPGNDVNEQELHREITLLSDNWFGGAEIQAFNAGLGQLTKEEWARVSSVDTESFYQHLSSVMEEAKREGLIIDLTLGSGWPSGGSHITPEQSMKTLFFGESTVKGPSQGKIALKVPAPAKPAFYQLSGVLKYIAPEASIRFMKEKAELVTVLAGKVVGGGRSKNPLNLMDTIKLAPDSVRILGNQLDEKGNIYWEVPEGKWQIIAIYLAPDGQYLNLSASPEPAFVVDHFDAEVFQSHLEHLLGKRTGLEKYYGAPLRGFFNDSFEFKTERIFTKDFLAEFNKRRGYDLAPFLPAILLPGADNMLFTDGMLKTRSAFSLFAEDRRIQYDYQLTVSDLFIERFIDNCTSWAEVRGLQSRVQAYGLNIDVLKAYGHSQIPETEQLYAGGYEIFLKMASSAGHLYNRPVISSESMVWMGKPYQSTPLKLKVSADKLFVSGINQLIYHGFSYRKLGPNYGETGWYPWGRNFSENISEVNPFWKFIPQINQYISRCQYLLRQGRAEADLLIYYPWFGFPTSFEQVGREEELLFNGEFDSEPKSPVNALVKIAGEFLPIEPDERGQWRAKILPMIRKLEAMGFTWDWVNDDSLWDAETKQGKIFIRGNQWKAVLIFNIEAMPVRTAQKLKELSENGARVIVIGQRASRQPGFKDFSLGDQQVQEAMKTLDLIDAGQLSTFLPKKNLVPSLAFSQPRLVKQMQRRLLDGSQIIFLANQSDSRVSLNLIPETQCENAQWLDPWKGTRYRALVEKNLEISAEFPAYGSMFLVCGNALGKIEGPNLFFWPERAVASKELILEKWLFLVKGDDIKGGIFQRELKELKDWREFKELKFSSSPGIYQTEFELGNFDSEPRVILAFQWIYGGAEVKVNNHPVGYLLIPPFQIDLSGFLTSGKNKIEIIFTPALHNRLVKQTKNKENNLLPVGLIGPARLLIF